MGIYKMNSYCLYTDGSSKRGWGAWAFVLLQRHEVICEQAGRVKKANSNRMEFQAVIEGLSRVPVGAAVNIFTDCQLLIKNSRSFSEWQNAAWLKPDRREIANADLLCLLFALILERKVDWHWVRAHSGDLYNERCDELCRSV